MELGSGIERNAYPVACEPNAPPSHLGIGLPDLHQVSLHIFNGLLQDLPRRVTRQACMEEGGGTYGRKSKQHLRPLYFFRAAVDTARARERKRFSFLPALQGCSRKGEYMAERNGGLTFPFKKKKKKTVVHSVVAVLAPKADWNALQR